MADLPTLEAALKLADQDSPLPSLAGPALKVLREHIQRHSVFIRTTSADANSDSSTLTALIAELRSREAVGRAKYGTDVDRTDLTNQQWRQHLREELMDALLYSLAEERTAPAVYGIDTGSGDKTVEAFGHATPNGGIKFDQFVESDPAGPNSGHGHVRARPDGVRARCGGPRLCVVCWKEEASMKVADQRADAERALSEMRDWKAPK